jgi:hypothetical protein
MFLPKPNREEPDEFGDTVGKRHDSLAEDAIDAWESEGGSSIADVGGFDAARAALADIARLRADHNAGWRGNSFGNRSPEPAEDSAPVLPSDDEEDGILRSLGAAVIMRWNTIPTKLQRELFDSAGSLDDLLQSSALKGRIARFLHKHKDDQG